MSEICETICGEYDVRVAWPGLMAGRPGQSGPSVVSLAFTFTFTTQDMGSHTC